MMNYTTLLAKDSMYNTPPCWCIYMTGLVLKYLENDIGGLANMQKINETKAKVLYDYLDGQDFFNNPVEHRYRSTMNVTFTSPNADLDKKFCAEAAEAGFVNLKGHRLVGGTKRHWPTTTTPCLRTATASTCGICSGWPSSSTEMTT